MTPSSPKPLLLEVFGEGPTDLGMQYNRAKPPNEGVVPIFVSTLCGRPPHLQVKCKPLQFLQGKGTHQKVKFAKRQAKINGSAGIVFVLDTEGKTKSVLADLKRGRDSVSPDFPAAVGVAHPCVEAWLLVDAVAIALVLGLPAPPALPADPESLPAPCNNRTNNPKTVLGACANSPQTDLAASEKWDIARKIADLVPVRRIWRIFRGICTGSRETNSSIDLNAWFSSPRSQPTLQML